MYRENKIMLIGNTEECYCGSSKTFKSCCKGKAISSKAQPLGEDILSNPNRINHMLQQMLKATDFKICMHPDKEKCKMPIKNAHSLQNNGVLSLIAEKDHVMANDLLNKVRDGYSTKRVSKNDATTFYGFCEYHDSVVFQEIELKPYENNVKQNCLFAYRACAQEYHKKQREIKAIQNCFKDNPSLFLEDEFVMSYKLRKLALDDVNQTMDIFNNGINNDNYDIMENYVYEFDNQYDFAVTTTFCPAEDLIGKQLNDIYSTNPERLKAVFITVIPVVGKTYFIISCLKEDYSNLKSYFEQIENLNEDELKVFLNNVIPEYSENIVLSPRLWGEWTNFSKKEYEKMVTGEIGDFGEMLKGGLPYDSFDDFMRGMDIRNGKINVMQKPKYDLFKLKNI
ncbi:hypothetical protein SAMN02746066_04338 [Anaerosporobacter mobilis DSM 15930]|jgi:hypothetical protein|uniref:SEC-C motif-containing protein n=2 Tax=Anaerosporobacter TaxID=653683 RepID=A0A1M7NAM9_9FIRM|nr:hypothetical protein SAMN02746066_04338 [Anaerosporobacter mobilis DSM 15930]